MFPSQFPPIHKMPHTKQSGKRTMVNLGWDKETVGRYNTHLKVDILPTRFGHAETLADLGIDEDAFETLQTMGIAPLCYQAHERYPDLARQVLATATITYEDSSAPSYANCSF
ncbi:hypothetical protein F2Q69_00034388 [Brassica cretica]|uniref:Uncharacterized protein n=1 Tax=Brassica cretica TaxID=69181 RepID=A0A8S9SD81_BRACR|nr:hypothetical protein F2Q69_00034388 [Brassica cretica]